MHIAFVINSLRGYGVQKTALDLASVVAGKDGIDLDIVVLNKTENFNPEEFKSINIIFSGNGKISKSLLFLNKYYKANRPDIIYSPIFHYGIFLIFLFKIILHKKVKLVTSSANDLISSQTSTRSRVVYRVAKLVYRMSDRVVVLNRKMKEDFIRLSVSENKIQIINNPVYNKQIPILADQSVEHPFYNSDGKILIGVGRLTIQKDFVTLIKAFALIKDKSTRLVILGEGGKRNQLEELAASLKIEDRLWMPGFVENPYKYISRADLFVLSSIWEGFGNVVVEALACGTKVVSTNCQSGPEEILENGKYGVLVPVKDPEAMAAAIEASIKLVHSKDDLVKRAQCFDANIIGAQYIECFSHWS